MLHSPWCFFPHALEKTHLVIDMQAFLCSLSFFFFFYSPLCLVFSISFGPYLKFAHMNHIPSFLTMFRSSQIFFLTQPAFMMYHNSEVFQERKGPDSRPSLESMAIWMWIHIPQEHTYCQNYVCSMYIFVSITYPLNNLWKIVLSWCAIKLKGLRRVSWPALFMSL